MLTITKKTALMVVALTLALGASAQAQRRVLVPRGHIHGGFVYDPFWGWGPYYPYGGYPYGGYAYFGRPSADVKVEVTPKQAEVYVDGFYAGRAEDFNGIFKRLHTSPGGHAITLRLEGYKTVTENVYVRPDSTFTIEDTMDKLAAGELTGPPPVPAAGIGR
jgi:hypothetical protein